MYTYMAFKKFKKTTLKQKVAKLTKMVKKERPEVKHFDSYQAPLAISYTGTTASVIVDPSGPVWLIQGLADNQRVADQITMTSLNIRYNVVGADTTNFVRFMVVLDKESKGAGATVGEILQADNAGTPAVHLLSGSKRNNMDRFKVLYDKITSTSLAGSDANTFNVKIKLKGKRCSFNSSTSSALDLGGNQIYLLAISDSTVTTHPTVEYWARLNYFDN